MIGMIGKTLKKERLLIEEKQQNKIFQHENIKFFFLKHYSLVTS